MVRDLKSANHADGFYWQLISRLSSVYQQNAPIKRGTKYSDLQGANQAVIDLYPNGLWFSEEIVPLRSSEVGGMPGERLVVWVWSSDWKAQSATNAVITYSSDGVAYPIYTRDYIIRRDEWTASQTIAVGTALTALIGVTITAAGTGYTTATGTVGNATVAFVCSGGALISAIVTNEGSGIASGAALTITGDGAGATATAVIQAATAILVSQEKRELPDDSNLSHEFIRAVRVYETLPGPIHRSDKWDEDARSTISTFTQRALDSAYTSPTVGSTYSTGSIIVHNAIASLSITDPGTGYISLPTMAIDTSPGSGTNATGTVATLKVVSGTPQTLGSGYAIGDTITVSGGTSTTAATFTVGLMTLSSLALNAAGSGYSPTNVITLEGGVASGGAAQLTVDTTKLVSVAVNAAGTLYVPADTITLTGGTFTTAAVLTVATTKLVSATISVAGTGGSNGAQVATGTTGTGTKFQINVTVAGGAITAIGSIVTGGAYTVNPTTLANEPVSVTGGGLTDARLNLTMGVNTITISTAGSYTANSTTFTQSATSGSGTGATFNTGLFGVNTFTILLGGGYSTTSTTFTQNTVAPSGGLGATFQTGVFTVSGLTVANGGAYTVIAGSPASTTTSGAGSGLTVMLSYGIGSVTLTQAGTLYYYAPEITLSFGNGQVIAVMDAPVILASQTGYVLSTEKRKTENVAIIEAVWVISPLPPTLVYYFNEYVNIPPLLFSITPHVFCNGTDEFAIVTNYVKKGGNSQIRKHRLTTSYSLSEPSAQANNSWVTQDIRYDGKYVNFSNNGVLNDALAFSAVITKTGSCAWLEAWIFAATTPSASGFAGQYYTIANKPGPWRGNMFRVVHLEFLG